MWSIRARGKEKLRRALIFTTRRAVFESIMRKERMSKSSMRKKIDQTKG